MSPRLARVARHVRPLLAVLAAAALVVACSPSDDEGDDVAVEPTSQSPSADACAKESLQTKQTGKLTIATDKPAYEPWVVGDDPTSGKGFESAVAYAVAEQMGFTKPEVEWARVKFDAAIQPGPKDFDFDINQFSISEDRAKVVDFSSPYYDVAQAVITTADNPAAEAFSLSSLADFNIGAQVGTTSLDAINEIIKPISEPKVYNTNDDAKLALENGQVDAIVVDLPTAFFITSAELDNGKIIGQLPPSGGEQEQFGLLLDKGSPLTDCVSEAVDALRSDGTLDQLQDTWLAQVGAPVLEGN